MQKISFRDQLSPTRPTVGTTRITVSRETRDLLVSLKSGDETFDGLIRGLLIAHPNRLTTAELSRRIKEEPRGPMEKLIRESRRRRHRSEDLNLDSLCEGG